MVLCRKETKTNLEKSIMLHIIDDFLSLDEFNELDLQIEEKKVCEWDEYNWEFRAENPFVNKVLKTASRYYDMEELGWYEAWTHTNSRPMEWHYDKHEKLFEKDGTLAFPICSCVYYPYMDKALIGGELLLQNKSVLRYDRVQPIENRLVLFDAGVYHSVNAFRGKRTSININPWQYWRSINEGSVEQPNLHGSR